MDSPSSEGDPGPRIHRPVPRRPFNLNFTNATPPPDEDSAPTTPPISASDLRFLDPRFQQQRSPDDSLSRVTSFMNLTSSTLSGIYQPATPGGDGTTPWGTGAETPAPYTPRDRPSPPPPSPPPRRSSLALRAALLFALGMGYGALVTRLPANGRLPHPTATAWPYLALWGLAGVALGRLLPWFDRVWEETFGAYDAPRPLPRRLSRHNTGGGGGGGEADWALVVRGIGAFVGIVFAIRRLPWTSTMQASLTLALANPFLWYLIDRSKPGFLLSAAGNYIDTWTGWRDMGGRRKLQRLWYYY
ncbi:insulin-induced protein-domain-containing protein [Schizothecium vesticola]|uniref:Insulin-induced protein-domain-containing protein n=1 Tax=Schizothecium vesticola TaxID=314040 RepID=A0AA40KBQ8_9PEZI|nr:insulin-induced protein-domain-containing protein [Schizothecium vesticola]